MTVERESNKMGGVLPKTKVCTACKQTKPIKEFKRRLNLAQTRAVLRNPDATTRYIADSKLCKACQPKLKPPRMLSVKEIRTRITSGDINKVLGEMLIKQKQEALPKKRSRVMRERWQKTKAEPMLKLKAMIAKQVERYAKRYHSSTYLSPATQDQNRYNYEQARLIRDDLVRRINMGEVLPNDIDIATLIKPKQ